MRRENILLVMCMTTATSVRNLAFSYIFEKTVEASFSGCIRTKCSDQIVTEKHLMRYTCVRVCIEILLKKMWDTRMRREKMKSYEIITSIRKHFPHLCIRA